MEQVQEHSGVLYVLDGKLLIFNKTSVSTMHAVTHIRYMASVLNDIITAVTWLISGILSLKEGVDSLYEYMCILATLIVLLSELRNILLDVKNEIHSNPRLLYLMTHIQTFGYTT